jgi:hypothetical protein
MNATIDHEESDDKIFATNNLGVSGGFTLPSGTISISPKINSIPIIHSSNFGGGGHATSQIAMTTNIMSIKADNGGDAYIKTNKNQINLDEMAEVIQVIKERLLILTPNFELHEKYPVLKDLYEQYKVLEAMLKEEISDK